MSMRTIVEFNHDYCHEIRKRPEAFVEAVLMMLNQGATTGPAGKEITAPLERFGVRCSPTTHHSVERKVTLGKFREMEF